MTAETIEKQLVEFPVAFFVEKFSHRLTTAIDRYGFKGAVFGASGGIDSLVTAALCVKAKQGRDQWTVMGLQMNDRRIKGEIYNADIYRTLGVDLISVDITESAVEMEKRSHLPSRQLSVYLMKLVLRCTPIRTIRDLTLSVMSGDAPNWVMSHYRLLTLLHRLRVSKLKAYADRHGHMVLICANRTETSLGYYVEGGIDDPNMGDLAPISGLYKTQVIKTAQFLRLPKRVIKQRPSPGFGGIYDEEIIGPYEAVDPILIGLELGYSDQEIAKALDSLAHKWTGESHLRKVPSYDAQYVQFIRKLVKLHTITRRNGKPERKK